jgi:hypothetical protein
VPEIQDNAATLLNTQTIQQYHEMRNSSDKAGMMQFVGQNLRKRHSVGCDQKRRLAA